MGPVRIAVQYSREFNIALNARSLRLSYITLLRPPVRGESALRLTRKIRPSIIECANTKRS